MVSHFTTSGRELRSLIVVLPGYSFIVLCLGCGIYPFVLYSYSPMFSFDREDQTLNKNNGKLPFIIHCIPLV